MSRDQLLPSILRDSLADVYAHLAEAIHDLPPAHFQGIEPELRDCAHRMAELVERARRHAGTPN